jgi:hypothetical protein
MKIANVPTIPHPVILSWCKRVLSSDDLGAGRNLSGASIRSRWWRNRMRAGKFLIESIKNQSTRVFVVAEEVQLNWSKWFRQTHRWLCIVFTVAVIINGITVVQGKYNNKLGLSAVAILALLLVTGLYLFVLPYANKWRG